MSDAVFLGLDKSTWDFINGFANWFAALGSAAAAIVALYIANRSARPSAKLSAGLRIIISSDSKAPYPEYIVFRIVNTGDRPIRIVEIGWCIRWPKRRAAVQMFDQNMSSKLPVDLSHGQEAAWYVSLNTLEKSWFDIFAKDMLLPNYKFSLWALRVQAFSSVGFVFASKLENNLLKRLRESCERVTKQAS